MTEMHNLPAIEIERLKACACCGGKLGLTFWMMRPVRCMLDTQGLRERTGLTLTMGSPALADVFAPRPIAREFEQLPEICVCEMCACQGRRSIAAMAMEVES